MNLKDCFFGALSFLIIAGSLFISDRNQRYKSLEQKVSEEVEYVQPPIKLEQRIDEEVEYVQPPIKLEQRISEEIAKPNGKPDKYGVIISGSSEERHKENSSLAYQILLENGFQRENVYLLDNKGNKTSLYPVDDISSKEAVKKLFSHLEKKVDSEDLLFVYTTGHGDNTFKLALPGENLSEKEMEEYLSNIHPKTGILIFDQCSGGNFAKRTGKGRYIGISASEGDKNSKSNTFPQEFFRSYNNKSDINNDGKVSVEEAFNHAKSFFRSCRNNKSDVNNDGKVSVEEAFNHAVSNDSYTKRGEQKPQIYSGVDASKVFLKEF